MIFPVRTDIPLSRKPWMNFALIAVNVIVFLVQLKLSPYSNSAWSLDPQYPELKHFISYAFLHGGWLHLVGNMVFLYIFGNNINDKMGHIGYLLFYTGGGVLAGLAHVVSSDSSVIGASGSVAAVTGAYLVLLPRSKVTILFVFILIGLYEIPAIIFVLIFFLMDVFAKLAPSVSGGSNVAHMAHIGGTLYGVTIAFLLLALRLLPRSQNDLLWILNHARRRREYRKLARSGDFDPFGRNVSAEEPELTPLQKQIMLLRAEIAEAVAHRRMDEASVMYLQLKALDPKQTLSRTNQLDVAGALFEAQRFESAAEAFETFLRHYPKHDRIEEVQTILGLIYARYLGQGERARKHLEEALPRLRDQTRAELVRQELQRIGPAVT